MILIDTNVAVVVMNRRAPLVHRRLLDEAERGIVFLSAVVLFELRFGIANSAHVPQNNGKLDIFLQLRLTAIDFDEEDAMEAGIIRADLKRKGTPIGPYDILIAAQARRRGAMLVTANTREFARVPGLALQDWTAA